MVIGRDHKDLLGGGITLGGRLLGKPGAAEGAKSRIIIDLAATVGTIFHTKYLISF